MSAKVSVKVGAHGHRHRVQKTLFTLLYSVLPPTSAQSSRPWSWSKPKRIQQTAYSSSQVRVCEVFGEIDDARRLQTGATLLW